jgi:hypothetical protein
VEVRVGVRLGDDAGWGCFTKRGRLRLALWRRGRGARGSGFGSGGLFVGEVRGVGGTGGVGLPCIALRCNGRRSDAAGRSFGAGRDMLEAASCWLLGLPGGRVQRVDHRGACMP